jgi:hypothetical protein
MTGRCGACRYFRPTGTQDSGIRASSGEGHWFYVMGRCEHPKPGLGMPPADRDIPTWGGCYGHRESSAGK